jgi:hypothetical protein
MNIKGYYFVRQKRTPIFLSQGYSIGVSSFANIPVLGTAGKYRIDSPIRLSENKKSIQLGGFTTQYSKGDIHTRGLICPDALLNPQLQSLFSGSEFILKSVGSYNASNLFATFEDKDICKSASANKKVNLVRYSNTSEDIIKRELIYVSENSPYLSYKHSTFSTKAGSSVDIKSLKSVKEDDFSLNELCVRGNFIPFIGAVSSNSEINSSVLKENTVYNIYTSEYGNKLEDVRNAISKRAYDYSEYTAICDPIAVCDEEGNVILDVVTCSRGDCFTCTSQHKFAYNFLDSNTPLNDNIVKSYINKNSNDNTKAL